MVYRRLAVIVAAFAILGGLWLVCQTSRETRETEPAVDDWIADSRFDIGAFGDEPNSSNEESAARAEWVRNFGQKERDEYLTFYALKEIAKEFPVRSGMTIPEMDHAVAENERKFDAASTMEQMEQMYNLGWEQRSIIKGDGWVYFWVNFKHLFHCDIVIESGKVKSVWVMPGTKDSVTGVYYRISGNGVHKGPGRIW